MTETKRVERRGGKRLGAGRPRKNLVTPTPPVPKPANLPINPVEILEGIAADETAPATARVSAARALLDLRKGTPEEKAEAPRELVLFRKAG